MPAKPHTKPKSKTRKAATRRKLTREPRTEWNIMFYIAGDSMLSPSMVSQLKEISDAGFQKDTRVLVYFDPNCNGMEARVFNVNNRRKKKHGGTQIGDHRDSYVRNIAEDCKIAGLPQIPSALSLRYFLEYARFHYPARNYMVFLVGHGVIVGNDAFLPDEDDESAITLAQLGRILKGFGRKVRAEKSEFHLVGFHSCSMSSVELAYELRDSARYMIGTQGTAFPGSWPYRHVLKKVLLTIDRYERSKKTATSKGPEEHLKKVLTGVQDLSFYNSADFWFAGYSADLSLCSLDKDKVNNLTRPVTQLSRALKKGLLDPVAKECIVLAHWDSQSYWGEAYSDLYDFCDRLKTYCNDTSKPQVAIMNACKAVIEVLKCERRGPRVKKMGDFSQLVVYSDYCGPSYQFSHGLSIYFPWSPPSDKVAVAYQDYEFTKKWSRPSDSWWDFLWHYFYWTQRPSAGKSPGQKPVLLPAMPKPPPKPPAMGHLSDAQLLRLAQPPPKSPGMAQPPPKSPGMAQPPKSPGMAQPPPKSPGMAQPPPKPIGMGLAGATVIKNFEAPRDEIITSRPKKSPHKPKPKAP